MGCCNSKFAILGLWNRLSEERWFNFILVILFIAAIAFFSAIAWIAISSVWSFGRVEQNSETVIRFERDIAFIDREMGHKGLLRFTATPQSLNEALALRVTAEVATEKSKPRTTFMRVEFFDEYHNSIVDLAFPPESFQGTQFIGIRRATRLLRLPTGVTAGRIRYFRFSFFQEADRRKPVD